MANQSLCEILSDSRLFFCAKFLASLKARNSGVFSALFFRIQATFFSESSLCAVLSVFFCAKSLNLPLSNVEIQDFSRIQLTELGEQRTFFCRNLTFWQLFQSFWQHSKPVILTFFLCFFVNPGDFHETRSLSFGNLRILSPDAKFFISSFQTIENVFCALISA